MRISSPIEALASALHHAALLALPAFAYRTRDWKRFNALTPKQKAEVSAGKREDFLIPLSRRPSATECTVEAMFPQTWGSTALGFGGIGGAAITTAYTAIIEGPAKDCAVYWAGLFAYLVSPAEQTPQQREAWQADLAQRYTASRAEAASRYGAKQLQAANTGDEPAGA